MLSPKLKSPATINVTRFLKDFLSKNRIHTKSLISTFFGDVVIPNDGFTWVETIFAAVEPLGVNERLVRTSLFRLREEGWVKATRAGRKSYYQLTEHASRQTNLAERLIYYSDPPEWDGSWTLVFLIVKKVDKEIRHALIQELNWIGFGAVGKGIWAHPGAKTEIVAECVEQLGLQGKVICMRSTNIYDVDLGFTVPDRELAALSSPIADVEVAYRKFIDSFSQLIDDNNEPRFEGNNSELLSLRLVMMDEFRRAILRDHHLPIDLLPAHWPGHAAFKLCGSLYKRIFDATNTEYQRLQNKAGESKRQMLQSSRVSEYSKRFQINRV